MKTGIVPHDDIISRNHGINIKNTLIRYFIRTQGFCLVISEGVLVEKNTSFDVLFISIRQKGQKSQNLN